MSRSPLGRPIQVGVFEHDPDAFNCFRNVPKGQCAKPGAEIDIITMVMDILDWEWEIVDTESAYGVVNDFGNVQEDGNFSGIMGLLHTNKIDMSGLSMRVTPERMKAAHFTFPIRYFQQVYIITKPPENDFRNFIFSPFSTEFWFLLVAAIVAVGITRVLCGMIMQRIVRRRVQYIGDCFFELFAIIFKQRVRESRALCLMILQIIFVTSILIVRGHFQSIMNSKLSAPPTSAIPFYTQSQLLDLFEKKARYPTYYVDIQLEGSNEKNQERINKISEYNPIVVHPKEDDLIAEIKKGGVFYSTYDIEFLTTAVSIWDEKEQLTVIRDPTGILSYVAFGFSKNNRKLCSQFNAALMLVLPGVPRITLGPGYANKKPPLDTTIQAKKTSLSLRRHLEQLFLMYLISHSFCLLVFSLEIIIKKIYVFAQSRAYSLNREMDNQSSVIDLELFKTE
ncbi:unnamed protein product [Auanema sp. JU1783]|nr:unnamed protein product [Auanema sp. JU1783]